MGKFDPPRNRCPEKPVPLDAPGVLMPFDLDDRDDDDAIFYTAEHSVPVTCLVETPVDLAGRIWRAHVHLREETDGSLTVVSALRDDSLDPLCLIPPRACRLPGVVAEFLEVVASIQTSTLRNVVRDTFEMSDVFEKFWSAPAAPDHHHWKGGLAYHTLEVARSMDEVFEHPRDGDPPWSAAERDLGLVAALLHDVAECVDTGRASTPAIKARRHDCGIRRSELVKSALNNLFRSDRGLGNALLELWCPTLTAIPSEFRVGAIRKLLLISHRSSEASTVRPLPDSYAVLFDRIAGVTCH